MKLEWKAPFDGGRPILFFRVQMKYNKGGPTEWADVFKTDGPVCEAAIENLKFESEVEFRIIAENKGEHFDFKNFLSSKLLLTLKHSTTTKII